MSETAAAAAAAVGARTARACDSCLRKRARWYCAADDAFLCQSCDHLVHSANQLARRHERVMLKSMSLPAKIPISDDTTVPSWHQAVRRKARSPRFHNKTKKLGEVMKGRKRTWPVVPDLEATGTDESGCADDEEEDVKLIHRVPVLDRSMSSESHRSSPSMFSEEGCGGSGEGVLFPASGKAVEENDEGLPSPLGFIPSNMDMEEFAMDVESLLGQGLDHESFSMDDLGLSESRGCGVEHHFFGEKDGGVKEEESKEGLRRLAKVEITDQIGMEYQMPPQPPKMTISLKLNYKAIVDAWSSSSPWVDGERPRFNPNDCLPDNMAEMMLSGREDQIYLARPPSVLDIGREAKVMRYKEKRRTRLFSKKIRYEVRKLNAEKRPRMKGREVEELKEVIEGKEFLLRSYKEQKVELSAKVKELQLMKRTTPQVPNIL